MALRRLRKCASFTGGVVWAAGSRVYSSRGWRLAGAEDLRNTATDEATSAARWVSPSRCGRRSSGAHRRLDSDEAARLKLRSRGELAGATPAASRFAHVPARNASRGLFAPQRHGRVEMRAGVGDQLAHVLGDVAVRDGKTGLHLPKLRFHAGLLDLGRRCSAKI